MKINFNIRRPAYNSFCTMGLAFFVFCLCSCEQATLFELVPAKHSGIHFNNEIIETDSVNVLDVSNVYNGGGAGAGDFNNDGLQDIYFAGNLVSNKLYLNKGDLTFDDITESAGVGGKGRWCRGVSVVDINNDGWQDIYVCATLKGSANERQNLLYINKGLDKNNKPLFQEMATEYGLNDTSFSTMAYFFDYDNDGDLDVYIVANEILDGDYPNKFRPRMLNGEHPSTGRLYRNDWNDSLKHAFFSDVSLKAGITIEGYGHSACITDINKDGWKDILVANDYISQDILYINNHDGTFTDKVTSYFKHTSANAMGTDMADINNDGLLDLVELDMNPEDNYRKKMMMNANSYQTYQNSDYFNLQYQYVRNTVQLNQGPRVNGNDSIGEPVFGDIGFFSGMAETDWSWTPMVVDFDNDGFRDVVITNGFPKDVTDHDFVAFRNSAFSIASKKQMLEQIPAVKIANYAFHNNGDLTFSKVTDKWGLSTPSFSNGALYADFDNDGDLDIVVNNINDEAFLYKNTAADGKKSTSAHFLSLRLKGDSLNISGLGTWIELYYSGKQQVFEQNPYRGYLSSIQNQPHFGLGAATSVDSVIIRWPGGRQQTLKNVAVDQVLKVDIENANISYDWRSPAFASSAVLADISDSINLPYIHQQKDFIDFNIQKLMPHKFSEYGPALAAGDLNGDGLDDIVCGGSSVAGAVALLQQVSGTFINKPIPTLKSAASLPAMDMGLSLFDADNDGDLDIYIASGGFEAPAGSAAYTDRLFINDGKGNFSIDSMALPPNFGSKSCVRASDFDHDGDLDLFIAGRVEPWQYPKPVSSFVYRNDSEPGQVKFTDVTNVLAPALNNIGLVCDAVWTDFDNDGWSDLILTGEWMPVKFFKNDKGILKDVSAGSGINQKVGWWTSIVPGDFDNDGDMDYIAGNLGLNSFYKASEQYPVSIYAKDFDKNESYDAIPVRFLRSSPTDTTMREFPVHTRDDMTKQMISFRAKFQNFKSYASAPFEKMLTDNERSGALVLKANYMNNSFIKNMGGGKFMISPLPSVAQFACMNGMLAEDFDGDGNLDILINGNDYGTEVSIGRYDACNGVFLKGDGFGGFKPQSILQSGWFVPGNGKALIKFRNKSGRVLVAASQNKGKIKVFKLNEPVNSIYLMPEDASAVINLKDGKKRMVNVDFGSSFLSQSARIINTNNAIVSVEVTDKKGNKRNLVNQPR